MTILEFLEARIAEDEAAARMPAGEFVEIESARSPGWGNRGSCLLCGAYMFDGYESVTEDAWYDHAETVHHQSRLIAEAQAKRRLLDVEFEHQRMIDGELGCCHYEDEIRAGQCESIALDDLPILRALAAVYKNHPDYQKEWNDDDRDA